MLVATIETLRNHIRLLKAVLIACLVAIVLCDLLLPRHGHYFMDYIRAYWTIFAVVGCFLLLKIGKGTAHIFLSRDEDYYDQ